MSDYVHLCRYKEKIVDQFISIILNCFLGLSQCIQIAPRLSAVKQIQMELLSTLYSNVKYLCVCLLLYICSHSAFLVQSAGCHSERLLWSISLILEAMKGG